MTTQAPFDPNMLQQMAQPFVGAAAQTLQQLAQQPGVQQAVKDLGQQAGQGARQGATGLDTTTMVAIGVGGVALLGIIGYAAYSFGQKRPVGGVNAFRGKKGAPLLGALSEDDQAWVDVVLERLGDEPFKASSAFPKLRFLVDPNGQHAVVGDKVKIAILFQPIGSRPDQWMSFGWWVEGSDGSKNLEPSARFTSRLPARRGGALNALSSARF